MCHFRCITCGTLSNVYNKECFILGHIINIFVTFCDICKKEKNDLQAFYPLDKCGQDEQTLAYVTKLNKNFIKSEPYKFEYCEECIDSIENGILIKEPAY